MPHTQAEQVGGYILQGSELAAAIVVGVVTAGADAPLISALAAPIAGAGLNVGISEGMRFIPTNPITGQPTNKFGSPTDILNEAILGASFADVSTLGMKGLSTVAATSMTPFGRVAAQLAWTSSGRAVVNALAGAAINYGFNPTPQGAITGAAMGFGFSKLSDLAGRFAPKVSSPDTTVLEPSFKQADITRLTGGKDLSLKVITYGQEEDITTSRQIDYTTNTTTVKDQSYIQWLRDFQKSFIPKTVEFEGQGKTYFVTGENMETQFGASRFEAPAEPFISALKVPKEPAIIHFEDLGKESNIIVERGKASITQIRENIISENEQATYDTLGVKGQTTISKNVYQSARLTGEMSPEAVAQLQKGFTDIQNGELLRNSKVPLRPWESLEGTNKDVINSAGYLNEKDFKPFYKPEQQGSLNIQQLINLPKIAPQIKVVPVATDILDINIREIQRTPSIIIGAKTPVALFAGVFQNPIVAPKITQKLDVIVAPKEIQTTTAIFDVPQQTKTATSQIETTTEEETFRPLLLLPGSRIRRIRIHPIIIQKDRACKPKKPLAHPHSIRIYRHRQTNKHAPIEHFAKSYT